MVGRLERVLNRFELQSRIIVIFTGRSRGLVSRLHGGRLCLPRFRRALRPAVARPPGGEPGEDPNHLPHLVRLLRSRSEGIRYLAVRCERGVRLKEESQGVQHHQARGSLSIGGLNENYDRGGGGHGGCPAAPPVAC